jgi:hypothetical protein
MGRPRLTQFVSSSSRSFGRYIADGGNARLSWLAAVEKWVVVEGDGSANSGIAWPPGRAETQMDDERQKAKSGRAKYAGLGAALGAGIGTAIGVATDGLEVWLAVGIAVGIATGVALSRRRGGTHAA